MTLLVAVFVVPALAAMAAQRFLVLFFPPKGRYCSIRMSGKALQKPNSPRRLAVGAMEITIEQPMAVWVLPVRGPSDWTKRTQFICIAAKAIKLPAQLLPVCAFAANSALPKNDHFKIYWASYTPGKMESLGN